MNVKFYKFRAAIVLYINKILTKILFIDTTPLFAVAGIIEKDGKVLFIDHSYFNGFGLPGGVVKEGESLEIALEREVFEETGLRVENAKYFKSFSSSVKGVPTASAVFLVKATGEVRESSEGKPVRLKPVDVLGKFTYTDNEKAIKEYLKSKS